MSVSLVDLRFEIGVDYPLLPHIHFTAPKLKKSMPLSDTCQGPKVDEVSEDCSTEGDKENKDDWKRKYRGSRELHTITIETLTDVDNLDEISIQDSADGMHHEIEVQTVDLSDKKISSASCDNSLGDNTVNSIQRTEIEDSVTSAIQKTVDSSTLVEKTGPSKTIKKQHSVTNSKKKKISSNKAIQAVLSISSKEPSGTTGSSAELSTRNGDKSSKSKTVLENKSSTVGSMKESRTVSTQKDYSPVMKRGHNCEHKETSLDEIDISSNKDYTTSDCENEIINIKESSPVSSEGDNQKESSPLSGDGDKIGQKEASPALSESSIGSSERRTRNLLPSQIPFFSGNHFVEVTKGILHLYKENQRTPLAEEAERSEMLCILAVPASMTSHDLLQFTAPVNADVEHMRIIREAKPNQYMVLIKFRNQQSADEFYKHFNGVKFNSIEPEVCHLVYVAKVETIKESEEACLPLPGHTELPTCPVCLERMDESVEGILTILCNHSFHGSCLAKWGDTSCPVCRYCQTPEPVPDNSCFGCGSQENLWICLICGHVGCGRYVEGHAYKHYLDTQHTYAMQLGNNRVWDYAGDNYVHRLVQNKTDGKPVELEPRWIEQEEKLDSIQLEYTYLLTSQLEAQRHFFENRLARMEQDSHRQLEELKEKTKQAVEERKQLEEKLRRVSREKQTQEKKVNQLTSKLNKAIVELKDEKEMNKCLRQNQQAWQQRLKETEKHLKELKDTKDQEIQELRDQVRDLMFYLEAQEKLQKVPDVTAQELQEGQIVVGAAGSASGETPRHRRKKPR